MNIEESVEYLKNCLNDKYNFKNATRKKDKEAIETLLTAYEKEKEKNKELSDKLTEKICKGVEEEILEEYRQTIISKDKEIEELKNGQIDFWISDKEIEERIRNKFVSNDKIKAKIEPRLKELDEKMKKEWKEYGNSREYQDMEDEWNFLQSLLEKE